MFLDFTNEITQSVTNIKSRGCRKAISFIKTKKDLKSSYYIKRFSEYCAVLDIKLIIKDLSDACSDKIIEEIEKDNYDFNIAGIILDTCEKYIDEIIPYKNINNNTINSTYKDKNLMPPDAKVIIKAVENNIKSLLNKKILIIKDHENKSYLRHLVDFFHENNALTTIAGNETQIKSSLLYDKQIIIISNNKKSSIGFDVFSDIDNIEEQKIIHGMHTENILVIDTDVHISSNGLSGNIEFDDTYNTYKYDELNNVKLLNAENYFDMYIIEILNNYIACCDIQENLHKEEFEYI